MNEYQRLEEIKQRGTPILPVGFYLDKYASAGSVLHYHWHKEWQWLYMIDGNASITVDGSRYKLSAGESVFINSGQLHSGITKNPTGCTLFSIVFHPAQIYDSPWQVSKACADFINGRFMPNTLYDQSTEDNRTINACLHQIAALCQTHSTGNDILIRACLYSLLGHTLEAGLYKRNEGTALKTESSETQYVLQYIYRHYSQKIQLKDLAETLEMPTSSLCRLFKKEIGTTIIEYLNTYRIYNACSLLRSTQKSIQAIAEQCGFDTPSYFIKVFKRSKGVTPLYYREHHSDIT